MGKFDPQEAWEFLFYLESEAGDLLPIELPEALLNHISDWAEARGLQIGGGYSAPKPLPPGPVFPLVEDDNHDEPE